MDDKRPDSSVRGVEIGSMIGGSFGLVFVGVNSGTLPGVLQMLVIGSAAVLFAVIVWLAVRALSARARGRRSPQGDAPSASSRGFPRSYWVIVGIEAIALIGGAQLLARFGYPEFGVAWVAVVVGTHFFALARAFDLARFHLLGAVITLLGVAGFGLGGFGSAGLIPVVSGVASGFTLLVFALWALVTWRGAVPRSA